MDISINTKQSIQRSDFGQAAPVQTQKNSAPLGENLSITQASSPLTDDTMGIEVAETALTRDDKLGNLVNAAFNLPAPPMPAFAKTAQE